MKSLSSYAVAALVAGFCFSACTAGGVAIQQNNGVLFPAVGYGVSYLVDCKTATTTTGKDGIFFLYGLKVGGSVNPQSNLPEGHAFVKVTSPSKGPSTFYEFDHKYDTTCLLEDNSLTPCSKDLLMLGIYDELSANAPSEDTHVRDPLPGEQSDLIKQWNDLMISCNLKP